MLKENNDFSAFYSGRIQNSIYELTLAVNLGLLCFFFNYFMVSEMSASLSYLQCQLSFENIFDLCQHLSKMQTCCVFYYIIGME